MGSFGVEAFAILIFYLLMVVIHLLLHGHFAPLVVLHFGHEFLKLFCVLDALVCLVFVFLKFDNSGFQMDLLLLRCFVIINGPHHIRLIPCDQPRIQVHRSRLGQGLAVLKAFGAVKSV